MSIETFTTRSEEETAAIAARLATSLAPGAEVLLYGDLGAGKTAFVRGLADGLGIDPDDVSSPTFTLIQRYDGPATLWHIDLYRLVGGEDVRALGLDELTAGGAISAVEWADRLERVPAGAIEVWIRDLGSDAREVTVKRHSTR